MGRTGPRGKFDGPLGGPSPGMGMPIPGSEEKPKLKIPEYLTRRNEDQSGESAKIKNVDEVVLKEYREPVVAAGKMAKPCLKEQSSGLCPGGPLDGAGVKVPCAGEGKRENPARMRRGRSDLEDPFSDMLCPAQVLRGMAWSMILGPRGGLHPKR